VLAVGRFLLPARAAQASVRIKKRVRRFQKITLMIFKNDHGDF
jgi:hypothetical protein